MAQRRCDSCTESYEAKRPSSRFCSERCRKRAQRGHVVQPDPNEPPPSSSEPAPDLSLFAATLAELSAARREDSALGVDALRLAVRIDAGQGTESGMASLSREWRATLAAATDGVKASSHVDELRERRAARRSG